MQISLHNIQSIKDATIELPDTGIVEFIGGNSNGKSILEKVISTITSLDVEDEDSRRTIISDGETSGYIVMVHNGKSLAVLIDHVRDKTVFQYNPDISDKSKLVTRTLREGGMEALIRDFGWCVYDHRNICLQLYPTFGAIPYINTSYGVNTEITEDVLRDRVADQFLTNYETITYKQAQEFIKQLKSRKNVLEASVNATMVYDYEAYEALATRLKKAIDFYENFETIHLDEIPIPPTLSFIDIPYMQLQEIPIVEFIPNDMHLNDLSESIDNLLSVLNGKCPTCGKNIFEGEHSHD